LPPYPKEAVHPVQAVHPANRARFRVPDVYRIGKVIRYTESRIGKPMYRMYRLYRLIRGGAPAVRPQLTDDTPAIVEEA
jgi:hypothetical protein